MTNTLFRSLQPMSIIAKGRYSEIYKYINIKTTEIYAIKKHPKIILGYKKEYNVREKESLEYLEPHPNIIKYYGYSEDEDDGYFILEFVNGYDLNRIIRESAHQEKGKQISDITIIKILLDVLNGLEYLHSKGVYHCDVKPENILVFQDTAKIVDFGSAIISKEQVINVQSEDFIGTPGYLPQEIADYTYRDDVDLAFVDLFGFGCSLFFCFAKALPFDGRLNSEVTVNVRRMNVDLRQVDDRDIREILGHILVANRVDRWTLTQVKDRLNKVLEYKERTKK